MAEDSEAVNVLESHETAEEEMGADEWDDNVDYEWEGDNEEYSIMENAVQDDGERAEIVTYDGTDSTILDGEVMHRLVLRMAANKQYSAMCLELQCKWVLGGMKTSTSEAIVAKQNKQSMFQSNSLSSTHRSQKYPQQLAGQKRSASIISDSRDTENLLGDSATLSQQLNLPDLHPGKRIAKGVTKSVAIVGKLCCKTTANLLSQIASQVPK
ncbi:hypothetical protein BSLG_005919 [Batrachochytrium salamandrivorans]|nr:hypothetical protein BSLG_005919 [Batrachochytrium salamandrivorans]